MKAYLNEIILLILVLFFGGVLFFKGNQAALPYMMSALAVLLYACDPRSGAQAAPKEEEQKKE